MTFNNKNITPTKPESVIPIQPVVEASSIYQGSYFSLWLEADNSANDTPLTDFSIVVKFKDGCALRRFQYYGAGVAEWNNRTFTYTINGINQWNTREHITIPANTTQRFGVFQVEFSDELGSIKEYIDYIAVIREIKDPGNSDAICSYNENNEFVCSTSQ